MQPRIKNPAIIVPGAMEALQKLGTAAQTTGVPATTLYLVEMRASQINGCSVCLDMHSREMKAAGESDQRIVMVGAWRESPYFSDAERAALALTEAATRLAGLVLAIAGINAFNRINAATRQMTGEWVGQWLAHARSAAQAA